MGKSNKNRSGSNKKKNGAEEMKKIIAGVLFMAACFLSVYVLLVYNDVIQLVIMAFVVLMVTAFLFLGQIFYRTEEEIDDLLKAQEALAAVKEEDRKEADAAFKHKVEEQIKSMDRTTRAMFMTMKKSAEAQEAQLSKMESRIDRVIDEHNAGIKTIIKYNKENARQMALSEKDALEKMASSLTDELKAQGRNQVQPTVQYVQMPMAQPVYQQPVMQPVMQPVSPQPPMGEENIAAEDTKAYEDTMTNEDTQANEDAPIFEDTSVFEDTPAYEEVVEEGMLPDDFSELVGEEEVLSEPVDELDIFSEAENESIEVTEPEEVAEPASNGLMSDAEIAELLASAGIEAYDESEIEDNQETTLEEPVVEEPVAEEPVAEEPVAEEPVAEEPAVEIDLAAASGVDLSDPNASLSADDIAKLFAAAGNNTVEAAPEEPVVEEPVAEEPAAEIDLAAASGVDLSDPNASLSADDIAKLFAAAGNNTVEAAPEEPVVEEPAAEIDLAAASGVDLSDPNASLSADDIAKLFAAAGNNMVEAVPEEPVAEEPAVEIDLAAASGVDLSDPNASLSADDIAKLFAAAGN